MQPIATPHLQSILLACAIAVAFPAVAEDATTTSNTSTTGTTTTTTSSTTTATSAIGSSATTEAKLAAEFADFLGGETQAKSVVSSLRQGTYNADAESSTAPTSSTSTTGTTGSTTGTTGSTGTTSTATSGSTGTMGYGEVRMTLRLAQAQLNQMGITQPTDAELAAVLQGGEVGGTQVDGILALRADGMGWGQIAQKSGMTVGQLMGKAPAKTATVTASASKAGKASATTTTRSASAPPARANGYIPSSPKAGSTQARSNGYIPSGKSNGAGMVSGAGDRMTAASAVNRGQTHKAGTHVQSGGGSVSAGGRLVSMGGGSRAGGSVDNPGHARKN